MWGGISQPSFERAVELLSRTGSADFERDIGGTLTVAITRTFGTQLTGTADHMRIVGGVELAGRVVVAGRRYRVTMMCERAVLETANDARIRLRAVDVSEEGAETIVLASRQTLQRPGRMTAIYCQDVVDGDVVDGTIIDLTRLGVTFQTARLLRRGDRLFLRARFFAEPLETTVRVASSRLVNGSVIAESCSPSQRGSWPRSSSGSRAPGATCRTARPSTSRRCGARWSWSTWTRRRGAACCAAPADAATCENPGYGRNPHRRAADHQPPGRRPPPRLAVVAAAAPDRLDARVAASTGLSRC